jgi:hypothetical protein
MVTRNQLRDRADKLRRRWVNAETMEERRELWRDEILPFNRRHPPAALTGSNLVKALKSRRKREREQIGGYYVDPKYRKYIEEEVRY